MKRTLTLALAAAALATSMLAGSVAAKSSPDTDCLRAGIKTLQGAGLLDDAARGGVPISLALLLSVTVRPGADISGISDPIPLQVVFADHRAGDDSLFIYPWCN
ncbi:MAG: hypothetical protein OEW24_04140 [Chloroflexota bacterium]|nr:hypothetical protein [Chloroflexota bacterium]